MGVIVGWALYYERGTPVGERVGVLRTGEEARGDVSALEAVGLWRGGVSGDLGVVGDF